jgi:hypothetical protein
VPISSKRFQKGDVFIDYDFESVLFRYEAATKTFFRRFYGEEKESAVPSDNRLLNDAIRMGAETDPVTYATGHRV